MVLQQSNAEEQNGDVAVEKPDGGGKQVVQGRATIFDRCKGPKSIAGSSSARSRGTSHVPKRQFNAHFQICVCSGTKECRALRALRLQYIQTPAPKCVWYGTNSKHHVGVKR